MNNPTCPSCDCVAGCQSRERICPNFVGQADGTLIGEGTKAVMQQALEFVEFCWRDVPMNDYAADKRDAIEAALRAAIAQPEQTSTRGTDAQILKEREITTSAIVGAMAYGFQNGEYPPDDSVWLRPFWEMGRRDAEREALIAQPEQTTPMRQPLTHTEIVETYDESMSDWVFVRDNPYVKFARAIEAAHGIEQPKDKP